MKDNEIRFYWLRSQDRKPLACVAYRLSKNLVDYSYAVHNPVDNFDKALGRAIAEDRLAKNLNFVSVTSTISLERDYEVRLAVMNDIRQRKELPTKVRMAALAFINAPEPTRKSKEIEVEA